ncbi:lig_chan-Glu_bd domain-containing protein [Nephila pilipes]|uniref:Lig_chan-Glu_bd domain-containing protein n=1 Tax=Nephila pilipes TaxID=299642 RepID=A0A8X6QAX5_NEPPI|nr:lig_chan-Glu_bd domain-containing protein [Nephila pilipes]
MSTFKKWIIATLNRSRIFEIHSNFDGTPILYGVEGQLLKSIMTKLDVDYEIVTPEDGQFGIELKDGNWTGVIGMLHRGEADIGIANLGIYEDRYRTVDFTSSYMVEELQFCYFKPVNTDIAFGFHRLFDFVTWMYFLGSLFLTAIVMLVILKNKETFSFIILSLFGFFLRQSLILHKKIYKYKSIFTSWLIFAFIMSSVYSGALLSFLAMPYNGKTVETFRELAEAVAKDSYSAYSLRGSQIIPLLLYSQKPHLEVLAKHMKENDWLITAEEMAQNPLKKRDSPMEKPRTDAVLGGVYIFKLLYGVGDFKTKVFISEDNTLAIPMGIALRKGFCCSSEVNTILSRIVSAGIYEKFLRDESFNYWLSLTSDEREIIREKEDRSLSVQDLSEAFILLTAGLLISFLVFLTEIAYSNIMCRLFNRH